MRGEQQLIIIKVKKLKGGVRLIVDFGFKETGTKILKADFR